jgi:hypothetical protein
MEFLPIPSISQKHIGMELGNCVTAVAVFTGGIDSDFNAPHGRLER